MAHELTETSREIMAEELSRISANYGIVCLTADPASVLMWSIEPDDGGARTHRKNEDRPADRSMRGQFSGPFLPASARLAPPAHKIWRHNQEDSAECPLARDSAESS